MALNGGEPLLGPSWVAAFSDWLTRALSVHDRAPIASQGHFFLLFLFLLLSFDSSTSLLAVCAFSRLSSIVSTSLREKYPFYLLYPPRQLLRIWMIHVLDVRVNPAGRPVFPPFSSFLSILL